VCVWASAVATGLTSDQRHSVIAVDVFLFLLLLLLIASDVSYFVCYLLFLSYLSRHVYLPSPHSYILLASSGSLNLKFLFVSLVLYFHIYCLLLCVFRSPALALLLSLSLSLSLSFTSSPFGALAFALTQSLDNAFCLCKHACLGLGLLFVAVIEESEVKWGSGWMSAVLVVYVLVCVFTCVGVWQPCVCLVY